MCVYMCVSICVSLIESPCAITSSINQHLQKSKSQSKDIATYYLIDVDWVKDQRNRNDGRALYEIFFGLTICLVSNDRTTEERKKRKKQKD